MSKPQLLTSTYVHENCVQTTVRTHFARKSGVMISVEMVAACPSQIFKLTDYHVCEDTTFWSCGGNGVLPGTRILNNIIFE